MDEDTHEHPADVGPDYVDAEGKPAQLVCCPDCGQMEWWTSREVEGHGKCRLSTESCEVCRRIGW